jgi:hypothetical protein
VVTSNAPFQLFGSDLTVTRLDARMRAVGYELEEHPPGDDRTYRCPWPASLVIHCHRVWCIDGENQADTRIELREDDDQLGVVDVEWLARQKLHAPLREVVVDEVVRIAAWLTGQRAVSRADCP